MNQTAYSFGDLRAAVQAKDLSRLRCRKPVEQDLPAIIAYISDVPKEVLWTGTEFVSQSVGSVEGLYYTCGILSEGRQTCDELKFMSAWIEHVWKVELADRHPKLFKSQLVDDLEPGKRSTVIGRLNHLMYVLDPSNRHKLNKAADPMGWDHFTWQEQWAHTYWSRLCQCEYDRYISIDPAVIRWADSCRIYYRHETTATTLIRDYIEIRSKWHLDEVLDSGRESRGDLDPETEDIETKIRREFDRIGFMVCGEIRLTRTRLLQG